jgi:hypothetical protein
MCDNRVTDHRGRLGEPRVQRNQLVHDRVAGAAQQHPRGRPVPSRSDNEQVDADDRRPGIGRTTAGDCHVVRGSSQARDGSTLVGVRRLLLCAATDTGGTFSRDLRGGQRTSWALTAGDDRSITDAASASPLATPLLNQEGP